MCAATMSWFDSSFTFARTAFSQAQKSLDKVLDIREGEGEPQEQSETDSSLALKDTSSASTSLSPSSGKPTTDSKLSPSTSSLPPSLSRSTSTPKPASVTHTAPSSSTPIAASQGSFSSTWGGADSLWSSIASPLTKTASPAAPAKQVIKPGKPSSSATHKRSEGITDGTAKQREATESPSLLKASSPPSRPSGSGRGKSQPHRNRPGSGQDREKTPVAKKTPSGSQSSVSALTTQSLSGTQNSDRGASTADKKRDLVSSAGAATAAESRKSVGILQNVSLSESTPESGTGSQGDEGRSEVRKNDTPEAVCTDSPSTATSGPPPSPPCGAAVLPVHHSASLSGTIGRASAGSSTDDRVSEGGREGGRGGGGAARRGDDEVKEEEEEEKKGGWKEEIDLAAPYKVTSSAGNKTEGKECQEGGSTVKSTSPDLPRSESSSPSLTTQEASLHQSTQQMEEKNVLTEVPHSRALDAPNLPSVKRKTDPGTVPDSARRVVSPSSPSPILVPQVTQPPSPLPTSPLPTSPLPTSPLSPSPLSPSPLSTVPLSPSPLPTSPLSPSPLSPSRSSLPTSPLATSTGTVSAVVPPPHSESTATSTAAQPTLETPSAVTEKDKDAAELEKGVRKEGGENAEVRVERDRVTEEAQSSEAHSGRLSGKGVEGGGRGEGEGRQQDDVVEKESASERGETSGGSGKSQDTPDLETLQQELGRVQKVLEARESRMIEMSREVIQLSDTNQDLQSRASAAEHDLNTSKGGVEDLRSEFAKRISTMEKKLQTVCKERDSLKKQLQVLTTEHSSQKKSAEQDLTALLREKEEQIAGLMDEGEKLSKKELQNSNIIKRLKERNKQNDQLLTAQRQQIEDCEREVGRLKDLVKKKEDNEKKYQESLAQLNTIAERQDKELTALKTEKDDLVDKARSLQANLDSAYKELSELHKVSVVNKSAAHEALLSAEQSARQELTAALENQRVEAHREKESLGLQIRDLRASVSRGEQQAAWREEHMKQEVGALQQRLQEAEMRNQELTTSISQTTKPFLRQIETLHSAHSTQTVNWEKVEANLTQRLVEAQTQLSVAVEKERSATERTMTLQSRVTVLENQTASLRQEKSRLTASLELEKAKAETLEEGQQRDSAKMEAVRASLQQSLEELRKEKEMLERQLEYERVRVEAESRKACLESQEKERLRSQLAISLSRGFSRQSSTASTTYSQSDILEKSLVREMSEGRGSMSAMNSLHHGGRTPTTSASAIEQLQSLIKQKEGELANAQNLVSSLERSRAAMANDLAAVSVQNVELTEKVDIIPQLNTKLQELQKSNEALLQMYGEKAELAEELKLDIQDLKDMYRQQIDELTKR